MLNKICIFCCSALIFIRHDYKSIRSLWWNFQTNRFTELCSAVSLKKMYQNGYILNAVEVSVWKQSRMIRLNWQKSRFTCSVHVQMHGEARSFHWHSSLQSYRSTTIFCIQISGTPFVWNFRPKTRSYRDTRTVSQTFRWSVYRIVIDL